MAKLTEENRGRGLPGSEVVVMRRREAGGGLTGSGHLVCLALGASLALSARLPVGSRGHEKRSGRSWTKFRASGLLAAEAAASSLVAVRSECSCGLAVASLYIQSLKIKDRFRLREMCDFPI